MSVDSQIGPSTRVGRATTRAARHPTQRGEGNDGVVGAVERGPDQLGHPRVDHDEATRPVVGRGSRREDGEGVGARPLRRRGGRRKRPLAYMEDPRDEPARRRDHHAPGLHGKAARPTVGRDRREEERDLGGEALRVGRGTAGRLAPPAHGRRPPRRPCPGAHHSPRADRRPPAAGAHG